MCFACSCTLQSHGVLEPLRLQNAMSWLHECCMGPALGWMPDHCVFSWAIKGTSFVRRMRAVRFDVDWFLRVFCTVQLFVCAQFLDSAVADRSAMAARMLPRSVATCA
jgi:hypothetical protein